MGVLRLAPLEALQAQVVRQEREELGPDVEASPLNYQGHDLRYSLSHLLIDLVVYAGELPLDELNGLHLESGEILFDLGLEGQSCNLPHREVAFLKTNKEGQIDAELVNILLL